MDLHLEKTLQRDIDTIQNKVLHMAELAERAVTDSLKMLRDLDHKLAYSIIVNDRDIDELEKELDRTCQAFILRQQPAAGHLRFVYSAIKINNELERIGDYAESIARQFLELSETEKPPSFDKFVEIGNFAIPMLKSAIQAFAEKNPELAKATMKMEKQVDGIRYEIHNDLVEMRDQNKIVSDALPPLMIIASRYERVADQACNICEEVLYMCTGENIKHGGEDIIRVLFVDERDSCRGQMAEGIAKSLGSKRLHFCSAGVSPQPVDPLTIAFMAKKGIDISGQKSRYLNETLNLDSYSVIVSLCEEAEVAFPPPPTKTIGIRWDIRNPSKVKGTEEEKLKAYEKTYKYLEKHIRDLIPALLGEQQ